MKKYYEHQLQNVINLGKTTIFWDKTIFTDRTIMTRPDKIICGKEEHLCLIIDTAVPGDLNIIQKEAEKVNKYRDLQIEVQRMLRPSQTLYL